MATPRWILVSDKASTWPIFFYPDEPTKERIEQSMKDAQFSFESECYLCQVNEVGSVVWRSRS